MLGQIHQKRQKEVFLNQIKYLDNPIKFKSDIKQGENLHQIQEFLLRIYSSIPITKQFNSKEKFETKGNNQNFILSMEQFIDLIFHFNVIADLTENVLAFDENMLENMLDQLINKIEVLKINHNIITNAI